MKPSIWSVLRLLFAAVIAAAIVVQLVASITTTAGNDGPVGTVVGNFFSFFTILSNAISVVVLTWAGISGLRRGDNGPLDSRGLAVTLAITSTNMIITGIVYNALLRGITLPQGSEPVPWSNEVLHLVAPLFLFADVFFGPFRRSLSWRSVVALIVFPLVWAAYTLVRGPLVVNPISGEPFWYPYPFLNPNNPGGWGMVLTYVVIISVAFLVVATFVVWVSRRRGAMEKTEVAAA